MDWYYSLDGQEKQGPVSRDRLKELFKNKEIQSNTLVWCKALDDWVKIESILKSERKYKTPNNTETSTTAHVPSPGLTDVPKQQSRPYAPPEHDSAKQAPQPILGGATLIERVQDAWVLRLIKPSTLSYAKVLAGLSGFLGAIWLVFEGGLFVVHAMTIIPLAIGTITTRVLPPWIYLTNFIGLGIWALCSYLSIVVPGIKLIRACKALSSLQKGPFSTHLGESLDRLRAMWKWIALSFIFSLIAVVTWGFLYGLNTAIVPFDQKGRQRGVQLFEKPTPRPDTYCVSVTGDPFQRRFNISCN